MADENFAGKVVVITGASSGFGKGAAQAFANRGASIVVAARRKELLEEMARDFAAIGNQLRVCETDVSLQSDVERLADTAKSEFGQIDIWVNNAGAGAYGRFEEVPLEDHVQVIKTDLLGTLYGSYYAMQQFRKQNFGVLINIASVIGKVPAPYHASYAAAKHGVVGLSASIRQEVREQGLENIRICTILPTSFDTPFFEHAANYSGHKTVPLPPVYDPQEVVDAIIRVAADPEDEVTVGTAAAIATFAHSVMPETTEKYMGSRAHKEMFEKAPPARATEGSLREPQSTGTDVRGGWKKQE